MYHRLVAMAMLAVLAMMIAFAAASDSDPVISPPVAAAAVAAVAANITAAAAAAEAAAAADLAAARAGEAELDSVHAWRLDKLAFGSCNKQGLAQPAWAGVAAARPQVWLWTGDAVYPTGHGQISALSDAFAAQLQNPGYRAVLAGVPGPVVEGVYDDHDYGANDAGSELPSKRVAQELYLDFIGVARGASVRRARNGVYSAHRFGPPKQRARIILLDTRTNRDPHWFPSVASWQHLPGAALLAAGTRWVCASCALGHDYTGDVLGEVQWTWFERQLAAGRADPGTQLTVIVSSIQVLTSNPLVESWGHFPAARARLLKLLEKYHPAGLVLLSGDVHYSELAAPRDAHSRTDQAMAAEQLEETGQPVPAANPEFGGGRLLEVTASGLTHSCGTHPILKYVCSTILRRYGSHRSAEEAFHTGPGWGLLTADYGRAAKVEVIDVETGRPTAVAAEFKLGQVGRWPLPAGWPSDLLAPPTIPVGVICLIGSMCGFIAVFYVVLVFSIAVYNGYNRLYPDGGAAAGGRKPTLAHLRRVASFRSMDKFHDL